MNLKRLLKGLSALVLGTFLLQGAQATVVVTGSGSWYSTAAVSSFSAPGASWSFSFLLPDAIDANPTRQMSAFSYALNGVRIATAATGVEFFTAADSGLFDLDFAGSRAVSFYGPVALAGRAPVLGRYDVFVGLDGGETTGSGVVTLAVPEPSTWLMLAAGLLAIGLYARDRSRSD